MSEPVKRTSEEIQHLKENWDNDPCWDIEDTPGFEEHYDELLRFRRDTEMRQEQESVLRLQAKARSLGCTGNIKLAWYVECLEMRLEHIEQRLELMSGGSA